MTFLIALCVFIALVLLPRLLSDVIHGGDEVSPWVIVFWALAVTMIVTFKVF
jgi:hypothetical protein